MEVEIGRGKKGRRAYGFDDMAIVPSRRTRDPDEVDITWKLGPYRFELPLLASAMDGVVSPQTAGIVGRLGGLAVLNLEGVFTRYEDAEAQLERIAHLPKDEATAEMQRIYREPIKDELIKQQAAVAAAKAAQAEAEAREAAALAQVEVEKAEAKKIQARIDVLGIQGYLEQYAIDNGQNPFQPSTNSLINGGP